MSALEPFGGGVDGVVIVELELDLAGAEELELDFDRTIIFESFGDDGSFLSTPEAFEGTLNIWLGEADDLDVFGDFNLKVRALVL